MSKKTVLRDKIKEQLLFQIHQGDLAIGKTINLAELSRETGISVTPIREALSQLEQVGAVILPHLDNYRYEGPQVGEKADLQKYMMDPYNWKGNDEGLGDQGGAFSGDVVGRFATATADKIMLGATMLVAAAAAHQYGEF